MANALDPHVAITAEAGGVRGADLLTTADGMPLTQALSRSRRRARRQAFMLVLPLLLFVLLTFVVPIGQMLLRSVNNPGFSDNMPQISAWFAEHPRGTTPDEPAFAALAADIAAAAEARTIGVVGTRMNYDVPGTRSLFTSTGRKAKAGLEPPFRQALLDIDDRWGDPTVWAAMRNASTPYTSNFYLAAVDRQRDDAGSIELAPENQRIYVMLFKRTLVLSLVITALTFVLGFPVAHLLATLPMRKSNLLMILVLLPFWTSLLVRTTAWMVLLQQQGVINDILVWLGVIGNGNRLQMIYNQAGHDHRDDAHPAAVHDPAAVFGDAHDQPQLCPRGAQSWARPAGRRSGASISRRRCRGWGRARCSCSSWRSAITSRPRWSAARRGS